ncbi:MED14-domain-containing protein [Tothia fuscella]|uniref:Mediator of RNA polymerase II transcription subunit 14 n=1 Tax=Tothia fuscella TaxID=1048955 RepID=A0A9P4TXW3_9PEZI|nr:MED14-domain-containing protein [Tothia fuscella]
MPGRLIMDTNGANGAHHRAQVNGGKTQQLHNSNNSNHALPSKPPRSDSSHLTNGDVVLPGLSYPTPNGLSPAMSPPRIPPSILELPPELLEVTFNFQSLGQLIERVTQDCYGGLVEKIEQLAKMEIPAQPPHLTNGAGNHLGVNGIKDDNSQQNRQKKLQMLEFATAQRHKFIKLLVLSQWSRNVDDVKKMINLIKWSKDQFDSYHDAADGIARIKFETYNFKVQNPDMETALSVLSQGKVPWMPKFGYIPPPPLTAKQTLKTLRNLNTLLAIRLNLHEDLMPQLRNYRIANGRVTFSFPLEFELDVTISDEEPVSPFFFIDVRFLFTPAPQISSGTLRGQIDFQVNTILQKYKLRGAYDFIHGFMLTHKIGVLRKQAAELTRGRWASSLKIEQVHRSLVVQYWLDSPQPKSWVEIGVHSGKRKGLRNADNLITSCIKMRWFRNSKEVQDVEVPIDLKDLSMERILKTVTALHMSSILRAVHDKILASASNVLFLELATSESEPQECSLKVKLGEFPAISLSADVVTGRLYLHPASSFTPNPQRELEQMTNPAEHAHSTLIKFVCYVAQQMIDKAAELAGWTPAQDYTIQKELLRRATGVEPLRSGFFRCPGFGLSNWVIAYTVNLAGESWWAVEVIRTPTGDSIRSCRVLPTAIDGKQPHLSSSLFRKIQHYAIRTSTYLSAERTLEARKIDRAIKWIPYKRKDVPHLLTESGSAPEVTLPVVCLRFSHLLKGYINNPEKDSFAAELLQLHYIGFDTDLGSVKLIAKGMMRKASRLPAILTNTHDEEVSFDASGSFALVLRMGLGASCVDKLVAQLRTIGRIKHFAEVLKQRGLDCREISLSKVVFKYANDLSVELTFAPPTTPEADDAQILLKLEHDNPHKFIQQQLQDLLNTPSSSGHNFEIFTHALSFTLPLCRAFHTIHSHAALNIDLNASPHIHPRGVDSFRLSYMHMLCHFDIRYKRNRDEFEWIISDVTPEQHKAQRGQVNPSLNAKLKEWFVKLGKGWTGMNSCIAGGVMGIEEAVVGLHDVVSSCVGGGGGGGVPAMAVQPPPGVVQRGGSNGPDVVILD